MRKWVVEHAEEVGLEVRERLLTNHDLLEGSFITGSLTTIVRIRSIDGKKCADPGASRTACSAASRAPA